MLDELQHGDWKVGEPVRVKILSEIARVKELRSAHCTGVIEEIVRQQSDEDRRHSRKGKTIVKVRMTNGELLEIGPAMIERVSVLETLGETAIEEP